ncbi:hypothetical protein Plim_0827 [Planctopirus limnophila DSM 3776]|uniref:Uncharacterized protein n=1 Tax=Planctopirus limnophila (strain ATCC 43296 / DSM 3776 / IFAM 1008 / Mu 290) TaxID=521674 RepID=D5SSC4_PLAL2|nr:hypothetical protein Plim_0827 [Planctopirus limnophila DSM 3776]
MDGLPDSVEYELFFKFTGGNFCRQCLLYHDTQVACDTQPVLPRDTKHFFLKTAAALRSRHFSNLIFDSIEGEREKLNSHTLRI